MKIKIKSVLLVGNIGLSVCEGTIRELFSTRGMEVAAVDIPSGPKGNRGYALVEMLSSTACDQALEALRGVSLDGRMLTLSKEEQATPVKKKWFQF